MSKPNILIIHSHDLGDYLGCYGSPVLTPNLDQMAQEGVVLQNHFSTGTICCPSRGSLWTGCYPHTHGLMGLVPRGWALNVEKTPALPTLLKAEGYQTALFGLQHEHWDPFQLGYGEVYGESPYYCDEITPVFNAWLKERKDSTRPFMASVGFFDPHRIGIASQGFDPSMLGEPPSHFKRQVYQRHNADQVEVRPYLADIPEQREELADFYGAVNLVDSMVGKILATLEEVGLQENTLVIFTTDHGASFMHSKATLYDGGTKVAFLMRWPNVLPEGLNITALTSHVDVVPTILEWLDLPLPEVVEGESFAKCIEDESALGRDYLFAEKNYTQYFDPARMVRSQRYKYIRNGLRKCIYDFVLTEIEMSQASFRNNQAVNLYYSPRRVFEELYDLVNDPGEMNNLVENPEYKKTIVELRCMLDAHLTATEDPFIGLENELLMSEDVYAAVIKNKYQKNS